jgi:hypothetical protein
MRSLKKNSKVMMNEIEEQRHMRLKDKRQRDLQRGKKVKYKKCGYKTHYNGNQDESKIKVKNKEICG